MAAKPHSQGKIVQCIGAVVDVEFPRDSMPKVYDALTLEGGNLTLEVQQQLGDGIVRTIALGSSDGLRRGLAHVGRLVLGVRLRQVGRDVADLVRIRPRCAHALLRLAHLRRGDHLHGLGDLLGVLHRLDLGAYFLADRHGAAPSPPVRRTTS